MDSDTIFSEDSKVRADKVRQFMVQVKTKAFTQDKENSPDRKRDKNQELRQSKKKNMLERFIGSKNPRKVSTRASMFDLTKQFFKKSGDMGQ
jgi:hypothetical protein